MKILLDTNILIPLEPTSAQDVVPETAAVASIARLAAQTKADLFFHPAVQHDLDRDRSESRRKIRELLLGKYQELPHAPAANDEIRKVLGSPPSGTNDWVDDQLLVALKRDAVDLLVTSDKRMHRKARRLQVHERVFHPSDAVEMLAAWVDEAPASPPSLQRALAHVLDEKDPFFDSLAEDYGGKAFFEWLSRAKRDHRVCWLAQDQHGSLEALLIVKEEDKDIPAELRAAKKVLKLCTFKVAHSGRGVGLGEQLLKAAFGFCYENDYDALFVTLFETKQPELRDLLEEFGFERSLATGKTAETVMLKRLDVAPNEGGLEANVRYGPRLVDWAQPTFVVPIQPRFCELLFPEVAEQGNILATRAKSANGIRKVYLCGSPTKALPPGAVLLFYRSQSRQGVVAVGVVETSLRTAAKDEVLKFAARRTVYSERTIQGMTEKGEVLAIRFREARQPPSLIALGELTANRLISAVPQSVTKCKVSEEARSWLERRTRE